MSISVVATKPDIPEASTTAASSPGPTKSDGGGAGKRDLSQAMKSASMFGRASAAIKVGRKCVEQQFAAANSGEELAVAVKQIGMCGEFVVFQPKVLRYFVKQREQRLGASALGQPPREMHIPRGDAAPDAPQRAYVGGKLFAQLADKRRFFRFAGLNPAAWKAKLTACRDTRRATNHQKLAGFDDDRHGAASHAFPQCLGYESSSGRNSQRQPPAHVSANGLPKSTPRLEFPTLLPYLEGP